MRDSYTSTGTDHGTMSINLKQPLVKPPRKRKAPTLRDADWEPHKLHLTQLHESGITLKEIMEIMEVQYGFHAGMRQYKSRLKKWNLVKNVKRKEIGPKVRNKQETQSFPLVPLRASRRMQALGIGPAEIGQFVCSHGDIEGTRSISNIPSYTTSVTEYNNTMPEMDLPTSRNSQQDLIPIAGPWSGSLEHMALAAPRSSPLIHVSRLWDIWSDYFHEEHRLPDHHTGQNRLYYCRMATQEHFASNQSLADRNLEHTYILGLPEFLALSLREKFEALERAMQCWVSSGANIEVKDNAGLTPLLFVQSSSARGIWRCIHLLIKHGANRDAIDPTQGFGPLQLALIWLRLHSVSGILGARCYGYLIEMEKRLIVLLEAGFYANATEVWGNKPPESIQGDELYWVVWTHVLARFEHRKSLSQAARDADLRKDIVAFDPEHAILLIAGPR